jgi:hypothetical protein
MKMLEDFPVLLHSISLLLVDNHTPSYCCEPRGITHRSLDGVVRVADLKKLGFTYALSFARMLWQPSCARACQTLGKPA